MFEVRQETMVSAAHQLRLAPGDGERLHGHNWRVVAVLRAHRLDARGMVVDFYDLERVLREIVEPYEHVFLNEVPPYDDLNPTAENIARVVGDQLAERLDDDRVHVHRVEVWETDLCGATYYRQPEGD